MKAFIKDFKNLVKLRLTLLVVFSASVCFLIAEESQHAIHWINWLKLIVGGFLVTSAANGFNEIIEKDLDKLMTRTLDRPLPSGRMTNGQALVLSLVMGIFGTYLLGSLNLTTGLLSVFSILFYAFIYTPLKRKSPIAVFFGAIPGALPPLIGYVAAHGAIDHIAVILFSIQFMWQFPHFWAIAWVLDDDYKKAGFRLLPTTKRDKISAGFALFTTVALIPISLLPTIYGFGGNIVAIISVILGLWFSWLALKLFIKLDIESARKLMFGSFIYLPVVQLALLFNLK
ncbi:heme o synthase [Pseudopedobacter beijingensis]|uniref:Protoheme IX farnesyltransferase n=1 Tax=Pseudopedobacter beijingensis TaxID=1207056 RepID=A0ABW4I9S6_9SPHI